MQRPSSSLMTGGDLTTELDPMVPKGQGRMTPETLRLAVVRKLRCSPADSDGTER